MAKQTNRQRTTELPEESGPEYCLSRAKLAMSPDFESQYIRISQLWEAYLSAHTGHEIGLSSSDVAKMFLLVQLAERESRLELVVEAVKALELQQKEV